MTMTLPYASMNEDDDENDASSGTKKQTGNALWRKWRPSLKPRLNRRRKRPPSSSSTAFPTVALDETAFSLQQQEPQEEPSSPPSSQNLEPNNDEECTTPRSEQPVALFDSSFSLTPPTSTSPSLVVSAKRLGSEVRRNHSKRRKGRMWDDKENASNAPWRRSSDDEDEEQEEGLPPVEHLSPAERSQCYWKWCYGDNANQPMPQKSWSASRAPPGKSCLSSRKAPPTISTLSIETPTLDRTSNPSTASSTIPSSAFETPSNTPPDSFETKKSLSGKSVQFGMAQAAEYELDCPPVEMTPMPLEEAKERFPLTERKVEEQEATEETKHNSATLAEWDNDFDSYLSSDDDDDSSSDGDESIQEQQQRRRSRRSSGFFSPDTAALLLPQEEGSSPQECDLSTDVNMASLNVRSPIANLEGTTVEIGGRTSQSPSCNNNTSMDTTPPSDIQLGTVHSTGGALTEANPNREAPIISSRQLHGALERCAKDENDIVMMLLQNPSLEMEWPTEQLFRTMSRHSIAMSEQSMSVMSSENDDSLKFLTSIQDSPACIRKHLLKEIECYDFEAQQLKVVRSGSHPTPDENFAEALSCWEQQKLQLTSLENLLKDMQELDASTKKEMSALETLDMSQCLVMKRRQATAVEEEVVALQELVKAERAERDLTLARLRHQEALNDLVEAAPYNVVQCLALSSILSFSMESVSPTRVDVSFSCAVEGPRLCVRWDDTDGISCHVLQESSLVAERVPTIASDHVASSFYRTFLFADEAKSVHPSILQHICSTDFSQTVLLLSTLIGRMDLALFDIMKVTSKSLVGTVRVERKNDSLIMLSISFSDEMHVHFYYDVRLEKCLAHAIPSRVRVIQGGIRMESLEAEALETLRAYSTPCLERICDAFFLASCM